MYVSNKKTALSHRHGVRESMHRNTRSIIHVVALPISSYLAHFELPLPYDATAGLFGLE